MRVPPFRTLSGPKAPLSYTHFPSPLHGGHCFRACKHHLTPRTLQSPAPSSRSDALSSVIFDVFPVMLDNLPNPQRRPLKNMAEYAGIDADRIASMEDRLKRDVLAEVGYMNLWGCPRSHSSGCTGCERQRWRRQPPANGVLALTRISVRCNYGAGTEKSAASPEAVPLSWRGGAPYI